MRFQNILLEQLEPGIYLLTVNCPKALNALNAATLDEIAAAIGRIAADDSARVLLVTGAGEKAFVAGADIAEMQNATIEQARVFSEKRMRVMHALEALPVPVIALVNGNGSVRAGLRHGGQKGRNAGLSRKARTALYGTVVTRRACALWCKHAPCRNAREACAAAPPRAPRGMEGRLRGGL